MDLGQLLQLMVELSAERNKHQGMSLRQFKVNYHLRVLAFAVELQRELDFLFGETVLILIAV